MIFLKKKIGQSSIEFVLIAGVMFFIFIGMFVVIQGRMAGAYKTRLYNSLEGLSNLVTTEIRLAKSSQGDYSREFFLPEVIGGYNYSINIYDKTEIVITVEDFDYVVFLDYNVSGDIGKRGNLIKNDKGNVSITPLG